MSCYFLCDYCNHAKRLDVFHVQCEKYGVIAKRTISGGQNPRKVCDYYVPTYRLEGDAE